MTPSNQKHRSVFSKLLGVKQETLDAWTQVIENRLKIRKEAAEVSNIAIPKLFKLLKEAHDGGMPLRELADIIGVSHATVANWLNIMEGFNAQENKELPTQ